MDLTRWAWPSPTVACAAGGLANVDLVGPPIPAEPAPRLRLVPAPLLRIETRSRRALLLGKPLSLPRLEFDLLHFLGSNPDRVFTRTALKQAVWPRRDGNDRTVDVHVRKLRAKLEPHLDPITTVRGVGYRFESAASVSVV